MRSGVKEVKSGHRSRPMSLGKRSLSHLSDGTDICDREKLQKRLIFEVDLMVNSVRSAFFLATLGLTIAALMNQRDITSEAMMNRQIRQEFDFEGLTGTFTSEEETWEYIDKFTETSRKFMPLSSQYVKSQTDRVILARPKKFNKAETTPMDLKLGARWSFTVWAMALKRGLESDIVVNRLPEGQTCWGWGYPASFAYGEHEFGKTNSADREFDASDEIESTTRAYQLMAIVFNGSHLRFFMHNSTALQASSPKLIKTTTVSQCSRGSLKVGGKGLKLAKLQFFGRELGFEELEQISRFGQPLLGLSQGREPEDEPVSDTDRIEQQVKDVEASVKGEVQAARSDLEAMHVTNARSIEDALLALLQPSETTGAVRRLAHPAGSGSADHNITSNITSRPTGKEGSSVLIWNDETSQMSRAETSDYTEFFGSGVLLDGAARGFPLRADCSGLGCAPSYVQTGERFDLAWSGFFKTRFEAPGPVIFRLGYGCDDGNQARILCDQVCFTASYGSTTASEVMYNGQRNKSKPLPEESSWEGRAFYTQFKLPKESMNEQTVMWRHLAMTVMDGQMTFYYDGVAVESQSLEEPLEACPGADLVISASDGLTPANPHGIAKLRWWKRLPSADELFQESENKDFRECKMLTQGEVYDDSTWKTANGHSCAWFASRLKENPDMKWCTNEVADKCPVACQVHTYCHSKPATSITVFDDVLRFDQDTLCVGKDTNDEAMLQDCLNWTAKAGRRLHRDFKKRIMNEKDGACNTFKDGLKAGEYCRFDQAPFERMFGGRDVKPQELTIAFWSRHFSRGYASVTPGWDGTWAAHCKMFPQEFQKYIDGDLVYMDRTGFEAIYESPGSYVARYFKEGASGKDPDEWLFHAWTLDIKNRKMSSLIGQHFTEADLGTEYDPSVCGVPEAFSFAMERKSVATGDARLAHYRWFNRKLGRGELQKMAYDEQDDYASATRKPGPAEPVSDMLQFDSLMILPYSNAALFVVPPLITSSMFVNVPCSGAGAVIADVLKTRLNQEEEGLNPYCSAQGSKGVSELRSELMRSSCEPATETVLSCKGNEHSEARFFGIDASSMPAVKDVPLFTELLYSLSSPLLIRDGVTYLRERYITALTDWMTLFAIPYDAGNQIVGVLQVQFKFSGTKHVSISPSVQTMTLTKDASGIFTVMLLLSTAAELVLLVGLACYANHKNIAFGRLGSIRKPSAVVMNVGMTLLPSLYIVIRELDISNRIAAIKNQLVQLAQLQFGSKSLDAVPELQKTLNSLIGALSVEGSLRLTTFFILFVMMLRLFAFMKVHPKLSVVVHTLQDSIEDVVHFLLCASLILVLFGAIGHYGFGAEREEYSSVGNTFLTLTQMILGDAFPWAPHGETPASALYLVSFILIGCFLLINALLGIVLGVFDAYKASIDEEEHHQNIFVDLLDMLLELRHKKPRLAICEFLDNSSEEVITVEHLSESNLMTVDEADFLLRRYHGFALPKAKEEDANANPMAANCEEPAAAATEDGATADIEVIEGQALEDSTMGQQSMQVKI